MKKPLITFTFLIISIMNFGQVPEFFNYQVIVRDASNSPITDQNVALRMSINRGSSSGSLVYSELHGAVTNSFGLVNLTIGNGSGKTGDFSAIDWSADSYFLKIEIDASGGILFNDMGTIQLLSVPYALHAKNADNGFGGTGNNKGDMLYWNGTEWIVVPVGKPGQYLQLSYTGIPEWAGVGFPEILITTKVATCITGGGARSGAELSGDLDAVNNSGLCYSTSPGPTIDDFNIEDGDDESFTTYITGLAPFTTYYARAWVLTDAGMLYANEIVFTTTTITAPVVMTGTAYEQSSTTGEAYVFISDDGGASVINRGVCWSTAHNPTISDGKTENGSGTGGFYCSISGLTPNTTYFVRGFATNGIGTSYGEELSFTTSP